MNARMVECVQGEAEESLPVKTGSSLMTPLGLIAGEVLSYIERHGRTTIRHLILELHWPATLVVMGVGALIRQGLLRGIQHGVDVVLEPLAIA